LTTSENEEEEEEYFPINSRSKGPIDTTSSSKNQKYPTPSTKEKGTIKKTSSQSFDYAPTTSKSPSSSKTLIISYNIEYNIVEEMKKIKANISLYEVSKLNQQHKLLLNELNVIPASPLPSTIFTSKASK